MRYLRLAIPLCVLLAFMLCNTSSIRAQSGQTSSSPLGFSTEKPRIGLEAGLSLVSQDGTYLSGCGTFTEGSKANLLLAAAYDHPITGFLRVEGLFGFQPRHVSGSYNTTEGTVIQAQDSFIERDLVFENEGNANFTYIFLAPSAKFYFTKNLYLGAGFSAGVLMGATTQYTKTIVTKAVTDDANEFIEVSYPAAESDDPHARVFPEDDRTDASSFALDGLGYAGFEVPVSSKLIIGGRFTYNLPLTTVFDAPELKLNTMSITAGVRYILK